MESRVRTLERASVPAEQVEFPGCVEADVMDRLGGVHAGNRRDRQRTVRALPAPVDAGARLDDGRPATGNPVTHGPRFIDARHRLVEVEVLRQRLVDQGFQHRVAERRPPVRVVLRSGAGDDGQAPAAADGHRGWLAIRRADRTGDHQGAGQRHGQRPRRHQRPAGGGDGGSGGGRRLGERHCSRPRTKMVAAVNVTSAIAASGHRLERMSVGGIALRTLPCTITRKWVSGIACASHCSATGMFSTGVAKPDISTAGTPMAKAPRIACCWVLLTAETISPMPTTERMNSTRPSNSSRNEPVNGMPNTNAPAAIITSPSTVPIASAGRDLDTMISNVEVGDTINWSKVPSSRSRAIDSDVSISALKNARMPTRPGTMNHRQTRWGLNQCSTAGGGAAVDRKSVVWGKSVAVRVGADGRRIITQKYTTLTMIRHPCNNQYIQIQN